MKKNFICFSFLFFFCAFMGGAQEFNSSAFFKAEEVLKGGLFENETEFATVAENLAPLEKELLYVIYKKDGTLPFCLNFFAGYGIGSFLQGDKKTGLTTLVGSLAGDALTLSGSIFVNSVMTKYNIAVGAGQTFEWEENLAPVLVGGGLVLCGAAVKAGFIIYSSIQSFRYAGEYNDTLKKVLSTNRADSSVSIAPVMDLSSKEYGLVACFKL